MNIRLKRYITILVTALIPILSANAADDKPPLSYNDQGGYYEIASANDMIAFSNYCRNSKCPTCVGMQPRTSEVEVLVPFEHIKTTDKVQALYLQAFVVHQDPGTELLAKSQVVKVDVKALSVIDIFRSEEDIKKIGSLFAAAAGIASGGDGDCPNCHGTGEVEEKASYGSYTRQCYYCDGTGRDPASSEKDAGEESSGSILDLFLGSGSESSGNNRITKTKSTKQTNSKNIKQPQNIRK